MTKNVLHIRDRFQAVAIAACASIAAGQIAFSIASQFAQSANLCFAGALAASAVMGYVSFRASTVGLAELRARKALESAPKAG